MKPFETSIEPSKNPIAQIQKQVILTELKQVLKPTVTPKITQLRTPKNATVPKTKLSLGSALGLNLISMLKSKQMLKLEQQQLLKMDQILILKQEPIIDLTVKQTQVQELQQKQEQTQQTQQQQQVEQLINPTIRPSINPNITPFSFVPVKPTPEKPRRFNWLFPREAQQKQQQAYYPEVRIDATKTRKAKWERVSDIPQTKESAISQAARVVDNIISAKGRVVPAKKKEVARDTGDRYFEINRRKFRGFQQKKGVRYKTPNQIIELQKYRADSPQEVAALKKGKQEKRSSMFEFR
jgi:hypothetical protein